METIRQNIQDYNLAHGGPTEIGKVGTIDFGGTTASWAALAPEKLWTDKVIGWPGTPASAACFKLTTTPEGGYTITVDSSKAKVPGAPAAAGLLSVDNMDKWIFEGSAKSIQNP